MYLVRNFEDDCYGLRNSQIFYDVEFKEYTVYFDLGDGRDWRPHEYFTTDYYDAVTKALHFCRG